MLHADEVEQFREDQDAFVLGQLIGKKEDKFQVCVLKVISGKMDTDTFFISNNFQYGYGDVDFKPTVNDYCVMSIKNYGEYYKKTWGVFKATSGDYKTLKLMSDEIKYTVCNSDIAAIEWYVNSGGKENDFHFNGQKAFVRRPNGQDIQIYPREEVVSFNNENSNSKSKTEEPVNVVEEAKTSPVFQSGILGVKPQVVAGVAGGILLIVYTSNKVFPSPLPQTCMVDGWLKMDANKIFP